jgi:hypothetical protein
MQKSRKKYSSENRSRDKFLLDVVKKAIDLKSFVEREGPTTMHQVGAEEWNGLCPLHKDGAPSFWVKHWEGGIWSYHCFGCNSSGTIVNFCMERYGILNVYEAALFVAEKEDLKCDTSLIIRAAQEAKIKTDRQKNINLSHFVACESCRKLLRMVDGNEESMLWIAKAYAKMNKMLESKDTKPEDFDRFRSEACHRMQEVCQL